MEAAFRPLLRMETFSSFLMETKMNEYARTVSVTLALLVLAVGSSSDSAILGVLNDS
jgi:hypothetical protein